MDIDGYTSYFRVCQLGARKMVMNPASNSRRSHWKLMKRSPAEKCDRYSSHRRKYEKEFKRNFGFPRKSSRLTVHPRMQKKYCMVSVVL
jgi:hypothetical protein